MLRHHSRLLLAALGIAAVCVSGLAFSCDVGETESTVYRTQLSSGFFTAGSAGAVCEAVRSDIETLEAGAQADYPKVYTVGRCEVTGTNLAISIHRQIGPYGLDYSRSGEVVVTCTPPPPPPSDCDKPSVGGQYKFAWNGSGSGIFGACDNGCTAHPNNAHCGLNGQGEGACIWQGKSYDGSTCTSDGSGGPPMPPQVPPNDPVPPLPPGRCYGTVNGTTVVVDCNRNTSSSGGSSNGASGGGSDNGSGGNGTGTGPGSGSGGGGSGSSGGGSGGGQPGDQTTKSQTSDCTGAACTTTTTTKTTHADGSSDTTTTKTTVDANGNTGSSTTTKGGTNAGGTSKPDSTTKDDGSKDDVCKLHPDATGCKKGGTAVFTDCANPPTCDGDAVTCAVAFEVHKDRCADQKRYDDLNGLDYTTLGTSILAGTDPAFDGGKYKGVSGASSVDLGSTALDQSGFLGGSGTCFNDKTVTFAGHSLSIPMSELCAPMAVLPRVMLAVAGLICLGILFRSVQGA